VFFCTENAGTDSFCVWAKVISGKAAQASGLCLCACELKWDIYFKKLFKIKSL